MSEDEDFIVDELPASRRKSRTAGGDCITDWVLKQVMLQDQKDAFTRIAPRSTHWSARSSRA